MAIGRFGCLVTGDTVGRPTDGTWGVVYTNPGAHAPQLGVAFQPSFLYEQVWDVLIFLVLWSLRKRMKTDGYLFALFLGLYAAGVASRVTGVPESRRSRIFSPGSPWNSSLSLCRRSQTT